MLEQFANSTPVTVSHGNAFNQQQGKGSGKGKAKDKSKDDDWASGTKQNKGPKCLYCNSPHPEDKCYKKAYKKQDAEKVEKAATRPSDSSIANSSSKSANKAFTKVFDYSNAKVHYEPYGSSGASYFHYGLGFHQQICKLVAEAMPIFSEAYSKAEYVHKHSCKKGSGLNLHAVAYWIISPQWICSATLTWSTTS